MIDQYHKLFKYNRWANEQALNALRETESPEARALLSHVIAADLLWFQRVTGEPSPLPAVFLDLDLDSIEKHIQDLDNNWKGYLAKGPEILSENISYRNSIGDQNNSVADILSHVVNHGTHHRAQIVRLLRQAGAKPPILDYIYFARL